MRIGIGATTGHNNVHSRDNFAVTYTVSSCRKKGSTKSWLLLQTAYVQMPVITFQDASQLTINIEYICII